MLGLFAVASTALVARAAALYDSEQKPLQEHKSDLVVPLVLGNNLRYTFESVWSDAGSVGLHALQGTASYASPAPSPIVIIDVPLNPADTGSVTFKNTKSTYQNVTSSLTWLPIGVLARFIQLDHVGIRKGDMLSMPAAFTRLALETPHIYLHKSMFNVLLQATQTSRDRDFVVDCASLSTFPDLVFALNGHDIDVEGTKDEIVITPEQYIVEIEGECILLARGAERGQQRLGWAAIRGRQLVFDWRAGKMGFGN
ncbi:hypothetical protein GQ44DRAFT_688513 [Phaeosphaeriaceae sp. PMI808]|nr:hypothetical protein GQ44DRAFT_688513 [Phaeosphaeriaceae sp. PMI808]